MTAAEELKAIRDTLSDYFDALSENLSDPTEELPSFEDYVVDLVYDSILTAATEGADRAASYTTGSLVDTSHVVFAILREFSMRQKTKADYIEQAADEAETIVDVLEIMYAKYINYYRGTSPEQARE